MLANPMLLENSLVCVENIYKIGRYPSEGIKKHEHGRADVTAGREWIHSLPNTPI